MAIAAAEAARSGGPGPDIRVFATDVDRTAIDFARRGVYPPGALRGLPAPLRGRYFTRSTRGLRGHPAGPVPDGLRRARPERARAVPADRPAPVPERPDLLHRCRSSGSPWRPSPTPSARTDGSSSAWPRRSPRCRDRMLRTTGGCGSTVGCPGISGPRIRGRRWSRRYETRSRSDARASRRSSTTRWPRGRRRSKVSCSASRRGSSSSTPSTTSSGSTRLPAGCSASTARRSSRTSSISPTSCRRARCGPRSTPPSRARRGHAVHEVEAADVASDSTRHLETTMRPLLDEAGHVTAVVIELTDVTRLERDRLAHARTRQRLDKAAVLNDRLLRANDELSSMIADLRLANKTLLRSSEDAQAGPRGGRDPQRGVPGDQRGARDAQRGADGDRRGAAHRQRGPRRPDRRAPAPDGRHGGPEARDRGGARQAALDPGQHRRCGRRGGSRWPDRRDQHRLRAALRRTGGRHPVRGRGRPAVRARRPAPAAGGPGRAVPGGVRGQRSGRQAPLVRGRRGAADGIGPDLGRGGLHPRHLRADHAPQPRAAHGRRRSRAQDADRGHPQLPPAGRAPTGQRRHGRGGDLRRAGGRPGAAAQRADRAAVRRQPDPDRPARDRARRRSTWRRSCARRSTWRPCCRTRPRSGSMPARPRCRSWAMPAVSSRSSSTCSPTRSSTRRARARSRSSSGGPTATPRSVSATTARASRPRTWPACSTRTPGRGTRARRVSGSACSWRARSSPPMPARSR